MKNGTAKKQLTEEIRRKKEELRASEESLQEDHQLESTQELNLIPLKVATLKKGIY
ncbi:hypothetical protein SESBI_36430 [Sesbania bispinosa]|nr:hypothetical protein SESBI_36430 [Sesbania bispinosa]